MRSAPSPPTIVLNAFGVSLDDLASKLGVSKSYVGHQLKGVRKEQPGLIPAITELGGPTVATAIAALMVAQGRMR